LLVVRFIYVQFITHRIPQCLGSYHEPWT
jgi:hypothetical protein